MKIADKTHSAVSMVKDALEKAKKYEDYHVFTFINEENALKRAAEIDEKIEKGEKVGRLAGVPYALKDNFLSPDGPTTASSKILEPFVSPITATAVKKLEAEGAIMIGRTNMDSFAHGSSTENSYFGPTKNAVDKDRVAGGSSGGSAVAVALNIVPFATGTDTGGSIRQPASFNGVYGFKPTYGTISRYGVVAMASSTDCIGFFARSASDIDLLMQICAGQDPNDLTTLPNYYGCATDKERIMVSSSDRSELASEKERAVPVKTGDGDACRSANRDTLRIGVISDFDNDSVDPDIRSALADKIALLKSKGHEIVELDMPTLKYALAVYYILVPAEISSNLSRHDGIRYGHRSDKAKSLDDVFGLSRSEGFMPENKRRIMIGNFVLSSGFYDAYYLKAQKARTLIIEEYNKAFEKCDFILTPVAPNPAFKFGEKTGDPVKMYLEDVMSVPLNLAGLPGLAIPAGENENGLPLGLQLVGPRRSDAALLKFAEELS
jgi:aspartyl-tRNA(Asn)/glutamyl-tRNA(Gln) amidotransferase subunit A